MDDEDEIRSFTELGERLSGPDGAEVAAEVAARLDAILSALRAETAKGVPFGRLESFNALEGSLVAARRIVLSSRSNGAATTAP